MPKEYSAEEINAIKKWVASEVGVKENGVDYADGHFTYNKGVYKGGEFLYGVNGVLACIGGNRLVGKIKAVSAELLDEIFSDTETKDMHCSIKLDDVIDVLKSSRDQQLKSVVNSYQKEYGEMQKSGQIAEDKALGSLYSIGLTCINLIFNASSFILASGLKTLSTKLPIPETVDGLIKWAEDISKRQIVADENLRTALDLNQSKTFSPQKQNNLCSVVAPSLEENSQQKNSSQATSPKP